MYEYILAVASTFWTNHHTFLSCSAFRLFSLVLNACGPLQQVSLRDTTCRGLLVSWLFFFGSKPGFPEKEVGVAWVAWIGRGGSAVWSTFCASLYNLDSSLASSSGSAEGRALLTAAKSKAERPRSRSPRDERPPIPRAPPPPAPPRRGEREPSPESLYSEGEESEEEDQARDAPVKVEEKDKERERRGSHRPAEPRYPRDSHRQHGEKRGKKRRGGKKHQGRCRDAEDPFRKSHRRLDSHKLDLAGDFREGLERRA